MKLNQILNGDKTQNLALREAGIPPEKWMTTLVWAKLPYTKESDVILHPWNDKRERAPEGYDEFADIKLIDEWHESFDGRDDPAQCMIDYVVNMSEA